MKRPYRLSYYKRRNSDFGHSYFLNFPPGSQTVSFWQFTPKKLREFCDAASDALDGTPSTVGPFHAEPLGDRIRIDRARTGRTMHITLDTATIEAIIADADEQLSRGEST